MTSTGGCRNSDEVNAKATFPFDVFKTRMQSSSAWGDEASKVKMGLWKTAVTSIQKEGWRVMFVGLWPTVVR